MLSWILWIYNYVKKTKASWFETTTSNNVATFATLTYILLLTASSITRLIGNVLNTLRFTIYNYKNSNSLFTCNANLNIANWSLLIFNYDIVHFLNILVYTPFTLLSRRKNPFPSENQRDKIFTNFAIIIHFGIKLKCQLKAQYFKWFSYITIVTISIECNWQCKTWFSLIES